MYLKLRRVINYHSKPKKKYVKNNSIAQYIVYFASYSKAIHYKKTQIKKS
jgi:hypothetical protein